MGFNTVAVILNDFTHEIDAKMPRLSAAIRHFPSKNRLDHNFGCGEVLSQRHADDTQIVVVRGNTGQAVNFRDGDREALDALADVLRQRGYAVRYPGKQRAQPPMEWNRDHWIA